MKKILVPTAGATAAEKLAEYVMQVALALDAELIALHIVKRGGSKEAGELTLQYFETAGRGMGVKVECAFCEGPVVSQIVDFAEEKKADLILMGASNGGIIDQWISSDVRHMTSIPVLVIPYQIF